MYSERYNKDINVCKIVKNNNSSFYVVNNDQYSRDLTIKTDNFSINLVQNSDNVFKNKRYFYGK